MSIDTLLDGVKVVRTNVFTPGGLFVPIRRSFVGIDSIVTWLNTQPYDSSRGMAADIKVHMEMVRASDSTVLWRGDTLSARAIGDSTVDRVVNVPLTGVTAGTAVYIRLQSMATTGLSYDFGAGFHFGDDELSVPPAAKRSIQRESGESSGTAKKTAAMTLSFAPNPTQGAGTLEANVAVAGRVELALYDARGTRVVELPSLEVERPGIHRLQFDTEALPNGNYMIVADINGERVMIQIQVAR